MSPRPLCKRNQDSGMSNVAEDHEYVGGRLSSFLDRTTGVMSSKDKQGEQTSRRRSVGVTRPQLVSFPVSSV